METEITNSILIYQTSDGQTRIDVKFENETVWLSQQQLCNLYQSSKSNISEHIKNIFEEGELDENSTCRGFRQVQTLSPVEKAYIETIKNLESTAKEKTKK